MALWLAACGGSTDNSGDDGQDGSTDAAGNDSASGQDDGGGGTPVDAGSDGRGSTDAKEQDAASDGTSPGDAGSGEEAGPDSSTVDGASDSGTDSGARPDAADGGEPEAEAPDGAASDGAGPDGADGGGSDGAGPDGSQADSASEAAVDAAVDASHDASGDVSAPVDAAQDAKADANLCGNGVVDNGEDCDLGAKNSNLFSTCSVTCTTTSLLLHVDASDPSGNGTQPADGTPMAAWVDLAMGRSVVQTTAANQPVFRSAGIGGKPAFQFDGVQTFFDADIDINASVLPDVTIIVVVQHIASDSNAYSGIWGADLGGWGRFLSAVGTAGGNGVSNGGGFTAVTGLDATATPLVTTTILSGSTANGSTAYVNGTLGATFTGSTNTNDTRLSIGSLNGPNNYAAGYQEYGYIAEVLVYGAALGDTDRQTVEAALTTKY